MKINIIGSGKIGGLLGKLWANAGHRVLFISRHPEELDTLVAEAGSNASRGTIADALSDGDVVFLSIPYVALEAFGKEHAAALAGKIVIETGNPYPERDGAIGKEVRASGLGTGVYSARWLPGCRLVRGFNSVRDGALTTEAHRPPRKWASLWPATMPKPLTWPRDSCATRALIPCWLGRWRKHASLISARRFTTRTCPGRRCAPHSGLKTMPSGSFNWGASDPHLFSAA